MARATVDETGGRYIVSAQPGRHLVPAAVRPVRLGTVGRSTNDGCPVGLGLSIESITRPAIQPAYPCRTRRAGPTMM